MKLRKEIQLALYAALIIVFAFIGVATNWNNFFQNALNVILYAYVAFTIISGVFFSDEEENDEEEGGIDNYNNDIEQYNASIDHENDSLRKE